jgi:hypothetical protein
MARPNESIEIWGPLEELPDDAALKSFKRGLEALIRDDFAACIGFLQRGIELNLQNAPLNRDMSMIIDRVRETTDTVEAAPALAPAPQPQSNEPQPQDPQPSKVRTDFSLYGEPDGTKH